MTFLERFLQGVGYTLLMLVTAIISTGLLFGLMHVLGPLAGMIVWAVMVLVLVNLFVAWAGR